jgi:DeoR/GlpR family transcriptional regulator of sugar metabolism
MLAENRKNKIKEIIFEKNSIKIADLVSLFNVSEETIRRDLNKLEKQNLIKKTYGGAILNDELQNSFNLIPSINKRKAKHFEEKNAIAKEAAELVSDNQIVILDAGTTTWCVASYIKKLTNMKFVTNSLNVAEECILNETSSVYLPGGKLIEKTMSLVGPQTVKELEKYNADIVFLGTTGISLKKGFNNSNIYETEVKRAMVSIGKKVVIVADHSKFNHQGLFSFATFEDVDVLVTSNLVEKSILNEIEMMGVKVIISQLGEH